MEKKPTVLQVPHLPTLHASDPDDADDNDDESGGGGGGGASKIQPINIHLLKDFMHKKVQKGINEKKMQMNAQALGNFH